MDEPPWPIPRPSGGRVLYALVTVVLPIACFLLADALKPEWQSGRLADYVGILLGTSVTPFFAPFLAYAVVCLALLLIAPQRLARFFPVRLGIYGGFVLALQYTVLLGIALSEGSLLLPILGGLGLCALPLAAAWSYRKAQRIFGARTTQLVTLGLASGVSLLIIVLSLLFQGSALSILVIVLLAGAPCWCLDIAAVVSFRLLRDYEFKAHLSVWHVVGPLAWLGAYGAAWRLAVLRMGEVYASLPTQPPECYVATAAASGHPRLVQSWPAAARDGRPFRVNRQLQRGKCTELALQIAWPAGHRFLRRAYDAFGPRLARRLRHPLLADAAYLLLKPLEWGSWAVLRALLPEADALADRFYLGLD